MFYQLLQSSYWLYYIISEFFHKLHYLEMKLLHCHDVKNYSVSSQNWFSRFYLKFLSKELKKKIKMKCYPGQKELPLFLS